MVTELVGVARGEAFAVDLHEGGWGEAAVGAITFEAFVPLFDCVLVVAGAGLQELKVLLGQAILAAFLAHGLTGYCSCSLLIIGSRLLMLLRDDDDDDDGGGFTATTNTDSHNNNHPSR